ncbi:hypothetical protein WMF27_45180 [Sorangium sp. So ce281]|uniref:hypothetical protein n=1 Tax=unclassified Sorangium TaxID=2621164 RepID=UPI003F6337EA
MKEATVWLEEEPHDGFVYTDLNRLYRRWMREENGALRDSYTWGAIQAAHLARSLGLGSVSLVEFGVAGGRGILALDRLVARLEEHFKLRVEVYGFDTGAGLPPPEDHRDLPNLWSEGYFPMDQAKLKSRLTRAELLLGLIKDTLPSFLARKPAPIGFVSIDLDLYSSTAHALQILATEPSLLLPRVHCYFDDIQGFTFSEFNGERLAIDEFNKTHEKRKISPIYGLRHFVPRETANAQWVELFYMAHVVDHPLYGANDGLLRRKSLDI